MIGYHAHRLFVGTKAKEEQSKNLMDFGPLLDIIEEGGSSFGTTPFYISHLFMKNANSNHILEKPLWTLFGT